MKWVKFFQALVRNIGMVTPAVKEIIRAACEDLLDKLEVHVAGTPNAVDDALVSSLREILDMPDLPDEQEGGTTPGSTKVEEQP